MIDQVGKILIITGAFIMVGGVLLILFAKTSWIGKLPGDINISKGNFHFYFPLTTSLILSILLSLIMVILFKFLNR